MGYIRVTFSLQRYFAVLFIELIIWGVCLLHTPFGMFACSIHHLGCFSLSSSFGVFACFILLPCRCACMRDLPPVKLVGRVRSRLLCAFDGIFARERASITQRTSHPKKARRGYGKEIHRLYKGTLHECIHGEGEYGGRKSRELATPLPPICQGCHRWTHISAAYFHCR